jgi:Na+/H+ antiporter NhaD/arsenite permease-like protein
MEVVLAGLIFVITYAAIASDRGDKTLIALLGGLAMILLRVIDQDEAFAAVDWNVIFLLAGMMALAIILRHTGFFQWVAIRSVKIADGDPLRLLLVLSTVCAVLSAFLDNVTTVVLLAPVTLYIATALRVSPMPFLIALIVASNIGGTATLIGDPPNILIGSASGLGFVEFMVNMGPAAILCYVAFLVTAALAYRGTFSVHDEVRDAVLALDEREVISDPHLLRLSLVVIGLTIVGFLFHSVLHYEPATIALLGAVVLMLVSRVSVEEILRDIEWTTLFFFVGLFILVEGIVHVGIVEGAARVFLDLTGGDQTVTVIGLLWLSAIASGIIDNIPYTATMIPVVQQIGAGGMPIEPLWWALALGACLGGNATIVGASANVVVANLSGRAGHPIGFRQFLPFGLLMVLESMLICTVYVWFRYLV